MKSWKLQVIFATIAALLLGFASQSIATSYQSALQSQNSDQPITRRSFGDWEYEAQQIGPNTHVKISSSLKGKAALKGLLIKQKKQIAELFQSMNNIPVVIIPALPLPLEHFTDFVAQHHISVESYAILAQDQNSNLHTIFGAPGEDVLLSEQALEVTIKSIEERQHTVLQVRGIVAVQGRVTADAFTGLDQDPIVLGLDLTPALAMQDLLQKYPTIDTSTVRLTPSSLYWINVEE